MALALQASLLARHAPNEVADAFIASRLAGGRSGLYGSLPAADDFRPIIDRARPNA
jgi:putative acyl-CoA dehydrogenase